MLSPSASASRRVLQRLQRRRLLPSGDLNTSENALHRNRNVFHRSGGYSAAASQQLSFYHSSSNNKRSTNDDKYQSRLSTTSLSSSLSISHTPAPFRSYVSPVGNSRVLVEKVYPFVLSMPSTELSQGQVKFFSTKVTRHSSTYHAAGEDNETKDQDPKKETYRERAAHFRDNMRERGDHFRDNMRERGGHMRDNARDGAKSAGALMKKYGPVFIGTYLSVYVATLAGLTAGIQTGLLDPLTMLSYMTDNAEETRATATVVAELLEHYTITEPFADVVKEKPHLANLAIAWIATKFTEPIRLATTAVITPRVARYMGIKPKVVDDVKEEEKKEEMKKDEDKKKL